MQNRNRNLTIDTYRGIGILFVIAGHTFGIPEETYNWIYSFHMPAFFILSGYLFNHSNTKKTPFETITKKFYRLIIPAWVLGLLCSIPFIALLIIDKIDYSLFFAKLAGTLNGYPKTQYNFQSSPLWFLFALFIIEFIAAIFSKLNKVTHIIVIFLIGIGGILISTSNPTYLPFNLLTALTSCFFFSVGMLVNMYKSKITHRSITFFLCLLIFILANTHSSSTLSMAENSLGTHTDILLNIGCALTGSLALYLFASKFNSRFLCWVGVRTLPLLAFNYYANSVAKTALSLISVSEWYYIFLLQLIILIAMLFVIDQIKPLSNIMHGRWQPSFKSKNPDKTLTS